MPSLKFRFLPRLIVFISKTDASSINGTAWPVEALGLLADILTKLAEGEGRFAISSAVVDLESCESRLLRSLCHLRGEPEGVTGDGNGVMSTMGPNPGEDKAEAGERVPTA